MRHYNDTKRVPWKHIPTPPLNTTNQKDKCKAIDAAAWDDLETVIKLAEGRDGLLFGRLRRHRADRPIRRYFRRY